MIALGVMATWIVISVAGAKGLLVFVRAAASNDFEVDPYPIAAGEGFGYDDGRWNEARTHVPGTQP